jgi:hypothetical protein
MLHIEYQVSQTDYVSASRLMMRRSGWMALLFLYGLPTLGAVLVAAWIFQAATDHRLPPSIATLIWGLLSLCMPFLLDLSHRSQYRKATALHAPQTLEVDEKGLRFLSPASGKRTNWHSYVAFSEDKRSFLLLLPGKSEFTPVPKRELDPAQIEELHGLLAENLPRK